MSDTSNVVIEAGSDDVEDLLPGNKLLRKTLIALLSLPDRVNRKREA